MDTLLHDKQNISPLSMLKLPLEYFLALSFTVKLGGRCNLVFLVKETVGVFTANLSMRMLVLYSTIKMK